MIPKIIHYCWFGGAEKSPLIQRCIETWRKVMPDYEIKEWNESNFDLNSVPFVREAHAARKWAFMADYVRLYAMYHEGGIYMDTDVKVMRRFDDFLKYSFFTCQESHPEMMPEGAILPDGTRNPEIKHVLGIGLCSAVMGAEKECPYLKDCLDYYNNIHFDVEHKEDFVIVNLIAVLLEKFGYRYILDRDQFLEGNMAIFRPYVFAGSITLTKESYALHLYNGSWVESSTSLKHKLRNRFPAPYTFLQECFYKLRPRKKVRPTTNRVLIVSTHLSHPTDAGNRAAIMAQVDCYKELGKEVHFLFAETSLRKNMDKIQMQSYWGDKYHEYETPWVFKLYRYMQDLWRHYVCNGYWKANDHYPIGLGRYTRSLDEQYHFDAIIVQYARLSNLLPKVNIPSKAVFTHDVFAYKDLRTGSYFYETCTAHEEAKALQKCPNIFAIQEQEAIYYQFIAPKSKIYTVYSHFCFHHQPIATGKNILFVASTMKFNVEAIEFFLKDVWPLVSAKNPDATFIMAGAICSLFNNTAIPNVKLLGQVSSLDDFYALGNIVINPVFNGTGLKIKTFEAVSYGKTTIVHPHSLTGVFKKDQAPLLVANSVNEWVDLLTMVLDDNYDHQRQQQLSQAYITDLNQHILTQYSSFLSGK